MNSLSELMEFIRGGYMGQSYSITGRGDISGFTKLMASDGPRKEVLGMLPKYTYVQHVSDPNLRGQIIGGYTIHDQGFYSILSSDGRIFEDTIFQNWEPAEGEVRFE